MIDVRGTESTIETPVLPGVLDVQTLVPTLMANPAATIGIDMGGVRVTGLIVEIALFALYGSRRIRFRLMLFSAMRCGCRMGCGLRSMWRDIAVPDSSAAMLLRLTTFVLTHSWSALDQAGQKNHT